MYPENRNDSRRVPCKARFLGVTTSVLRGDVLDVSRTGLRLCLDEALERGRELHLEFELPTGRVEAVGEVRWVNEEGKAPGKGRTQSNAKPKAKATASPSAEQKGKPEPVEHGIRFVRISSESLDVIARATPTK